MYNMDNFELSNNEFMGRVNNTISGVFVDIIGNNRKVASYEVFLRNIEADINRTPSLNSYADLYKHILAANIQVLETLASLEELMLMIKVSETTENIKLTLVRNYIYARCSFFRKEKEAHDIRVIVGSSKVFGRDLDGLSKNELFMARAREKLQKAMKAELSLKLQDFEMQFMNRAN
jgi:hypothetical protein